MINEIDGIAKIYMVSTIHQKVEIKALNKTYEFIEGESIHNEISRKYNDSIIEKIISKTDFNIAAKIMDSKAYFAEYILTRS
ncbi:L-histidine N(alpha)-methyltransferase [Formosa sp. PL04]|uniref:L-histidine N(alpha)-methyltransferase n=1 Tax=Formosa sp. PL04 TaxID=3081755 RepID=UPI0029811BEA|nr:L-histidine N(alpha)-methyltransferase [Formosa sp. PL04]MDW5288723.1 L-histidine N(alpha)-methyltransferase [Formosa sp. PL04]